MRVLAQGGGGALAGLRQSEHSTQGMAAAQGGRPGGRCCRQLSRRWLSKLQAPVRPFSLHTLRKPE